MVDYLLELLARVGSWSYALLFVAATLESSAFVGLFVPGDTIALIAGFLAWEGVLELPETIAVAAAGAVLGDSIGYELGRRLGRPWLLRHGNRFGLHRRRLQLLDELFERHGGKTVLFSRFIAFVRALAPFVAGSSRMPYLRFLAFNIVGAVLWAVALVSLGYLLGASWRIAEQWVGRVGVVVGVIVIALVIIWFRWRRAASRAR
ncbi:MAG TPA: DedA family protein [Methylomirabilota bacterium]|nr:DedA family protein [Methylomirabilota bacterium]